MKTIDSEEVRIRERHAAWKRGEYEMETVAEAARLGKACSEDWQVQYRRVPFENASGWRDCYTVERLDRKIRAHA